MTEANDQIATLRALLPEIEGGEGPLTDEALATLITIFRSVDGTHESAKRETMVLSSGEELEWLTITAQEAGGWSTFIDKRMRGVFPDVDLTAADDLVREVLPEAVRDYQISEDVGNTAEITVYKPRLEDTTVFGVDNEHSICRAILAALVRARIEELEAKP